VGPYGELGHAQVGEKRHREVRAEWCHCQWGEGLQASLWKVARWGRSRGAQADVDRERQAGKRALLREYLAACTTAFCSECAPTSRKLPDSENICIFVAQRDDFQALRAEEADLVPIEIRRGSSGAQGQGGRPANTLEDYLPSKRWVSGESGGASCHSAESSGKASLYLSIQESKTLCHPPGDTAPGTEVSFILCPPILRRLQEFAAEVHQAGTLRLAQRGA